MPFEGILLLLVLLCLQVEIFIRANGKVKWYLRVFVCFPIGVTPSHLIRLWHIESTGCNNVNSQVERVRFMFNSLVTFFGLLFYLVGREVCHFTMVVVWVVLIGALADNPPKSADDPACAIEINPPATIALCVLTMCMSLWQFYILGKMFYNMRKQSASQALTLTDRAFRRSLVGDILMNVSTAISFALWIRALGSSDVLVEISRLHTYFDYIWFDGTLNTVILAYIFIRKVPESDRSGSNSRGRSAAATSGLDTTAQSQTPSCPDTPQVELQEKTTKLNPTTSLQTV
uniref:Uncharacterized protein n=1 Tax=Mucochytrium quahogii TaxID=96639 RepID=A0A7S2SFI3_9STRA|mmetsp:Transcript_8076/g.13006  ORF Transcript_8076/g.13006 Transcript_8076/m.13006 type:complete len:288 (+) Transcript_8076:296-1159(+)